VLHFNAPGDYEDKLYLSRNYPTVYLILKTVHDRIFIRLDKTPECDGRTDRETDRRTDRQISSGYCEQCGRAV